jgi:hypothetical protein
LKGQSYVEVALAALGQMVDKNQQARVEEASRGKLWAALRQLLVVDVID